MAKLALSEGVAVTALFVLVNACALTLCALPRTLAPTELPALRLSEAQTRAVLAADATAQRRAPTSPSALELSRLYLEHGEAESRTVEDAAIYRKRRAAIARSYAAVLAQHGQAGVVALRARELGRLEAALALELPEEQVTGVMGIFATALAQHGATRDQEVVAPHFVVRTLYKARWNRAMGLSPDFALQPVELRALHGFLALHAENLDPARRIAELEVYANAGGSRLAEAHGVLLFEDRQPALAAEALRAAYAQSGSLRLRNYVQGARLAAGRGEPSAR